MKEVFRILKPEGRLILTGFNPKSLWGLSSWFDGKRLPMKSQCLALAKMKRRIADIGFEMEYGQFMDYLPAVNSPSALKFLAVYGKGGGQVVATVCGGVWCGFNETSDWCPSFA